MRKYYTYVLEDLTGNVFYVGKGSKTESYDRVEYHINYWYKNKNKKLINKIKKIEGIFKVVMVLESEVEKECLDKEIDLIKQYGRNTLCNLTDGGEGITGYRHSTESKAKMAAHADKDKAKRNLLKAAKANIGKRKGAAFCLEELYITHNIYEIKEITGLDFTTIKRYLVEKGLYVRNKNRKQTSVETRQRKSEGQRSRKRREILQFDVQGNLVNTWSSINQASENIKGDIRACVKGRQKTAGGYIWKYKEN